MWNEDLYTKALKFAGEAHKNQKFPGTEMPYLVHVVQVCMETQSAILNCSANNFDINFAMQVALLHDVIEDTSYTHNDIKNEFNYDIAEAVLALSKNTELPKEQQMIDSLNRILKQPNEVRIIKMADRISNLQRPPAYWIENKIFTYKNEAQTILNFLKGVNDYIENRLSQKINEYSKFIATLQ